MDYVLPMLIIRSDVPSLIEINGRLQGEVAPEGYLALPLSDTGDYYICAIPLIDDRDVRRFSITRKLSLTDVGEAYLRHCQALRESALAIAARYAAR